MCLPTTAQHTQHNTTLNAPPLLLLLLLLLLRFHLQLLGNALNPNAARPLGGNNAAGGLGNLMQPQTMQGAMTAAQCMMGLGRRLQQAFGSRASQMATNNLRSQAATSQVRGGDVVT
jgi:hypothetical protein